MTAAWLALAIVIAGAAALVGASLLGFLHGIAGGQLAGVVAMVALAVWLGPGLLARYRGRGSQALQHAAIWLALIAAIAVLYRFRGDIFPNS